MTDVMMGMEKTLDGENERAALRLGHARCVAPIVRCEHAPTGLQNARVQQQALEIWEARLEPLIGRHLLHQLLPMGLLWTRRD